MGNLPSQHPKLSGTPPDLSNVDAKLKNIISHFKSATGTDLYTLKGAQFLQVINALVQGGGIFKDTVVPPTQDGFSKMMNTPQSVTDVVYAYYFKKADSSSSGSGKSWSEFLFGSGSVSSETPSTTSEEENVAKLLATVQAAGGTSTVPAVAVGGATTQPVTPKTPVPDWTSYGSNLSGQAINALIAQGNANAGIPPQPTPNVGSTA